MAVQYDYIEEILPREIAFVSTQELVDMYPELTPKEREYQIVKEKGAVFLMQVGKTLTNGERHDGAFEAKDLSTQKTDASIKELQERIVHLEKQVEFLKKISNIVTNPKLQ